LKTRKRTTPGIPTWSPTVVSTNLVVPAGM
jgi:hypothetical protein